ncbi:M48 family metalloprotease [Ferribacterium limneticum]|uniref:hypothetical protein n=1 Tax=Ferribacterium limneticum TaxID=76259 RepID=UPI001CF87E28|nr:hypothetical protein [Ferribacterium limneticum]UCV23829.1 hypothetical protein KI613_04645 [Ferribacterium limneticum]
MALKKIIISTFDYFTSWISAAMDQFTKRPPHLSESDPYYKELERVIVEKYFQLPGANATREINLTDRISDSEFVADAAHLFGCNKAEIANAFNVSLPTQFDDPLSYITIIQLIKSIREQLPSIDSQHKLDESNYGGFCCAPTGKVSACAEPIRPPNQSSKVFIVFESGLLTYIHGIISTILMAIPPNLLEGENLESWRAQWEEYKLIEASLLSEDSAALKAWVSFFSSYNLRSDLSYIPNSDIPPIARSIIAGMTFGCEVFITAHEYAHALLRHQNAKLNDHQVELDADELGARIAYQACTDKGLGFPIVAAGIAIFLNAIELGGAQTGTHLPAAQRIKHIVNSLIGLSTEEKSISLDLATVFTEVLRDLNTHQ